MHLSTVKIPFNFGLDWHCLSISFLISKPILHQPEKMLFASFLLYILEWDHPFQVAPTCCLCGVTCKLKASSGLTEVSIFRHSISTVEMRSNHNYLCECISLTNSSNGLNKHVTSDSTIDIGLDSRKPWIQAGTLRPELDHNTGRHFDTPLRLVTSRPSFRQTRPLASHNISIIVHETSKFRYTWRESWCNCVWKTLYLNLYSQLASVEIHLRPFPHHGLGRDHVIRHRSGIRVWLAEHPLRIVWLPFTIAGEMLVC